MKLTPTYKFMLAASVGVAAIVASIPHAQAEIQFEDIDQLGTSDYELEIKSAVYNLVSRGVINGMDESHYAPQNSIRRSEVAKIISLAKNYDLSNVTNPNFTDVHPDSWYYPYIAALKSEGILNGYQDGTFNPDGFITRAEMSKVIALAFNLKTTTGTHPFKDIPADHYAHSYIAQLFDNQVTTGVDSITYGYDLPVTRAQLAVFTIRAEKAAKDETPTNVGKSLILNAADYGFTTFTTPEADGTNIYSVSNSASSVLITALNVGKGKLLLKGTNASGQAQEAFYLVNVEMINGKVQAALEKANVAEYTEAQAQYYSYHSLNLGFVPALATIKQNNVDIGDKGYVNLDEAGLDLTIYAPGTYTLTLENGAKSKSFTLNVSLKNFKTKIDLN